MKVVRLSVLRTGRLYHPGHIPSTHFCLRLSQPQGHNAARRIMPMKNSSDIFGNRTRDLPACSAVSQPTACPILSGRTLLKTRRNFTYALLVTNNIRVISLLGSESTSKLKRPLEGSSISCNSTSFENGKLNLHIRPFSERAEEHPSNLLSSPMQPGFPLRLKPPHLPSECLFFLCNMYYNLTPRGSYSTPTSFSFRFTANIMHT